MYNIYTTNTSKIFINSISIHIIKFKFLFFRRINMIKTKKNTPSSISPDEIVTLYKTPFENIIVSSYRQPGKGSIVKLNGDYYLNTATNEILPYKKSVCRSKEGVRKTLIDFRKYLRFFCGGYSYL